MSAVALRGGRRPRLLHRRRGLPRAHVAPTPLPPLDPRLEVVRTTLVLLVVFSVCLIVELLLVSALQHEAAQRRAFADFRGDLAAGTAPLAAGDLDDRIGTPVAYLEIPSIGLRQVVLEGTAAGTLSRGPGHRRDTRLPGQAGTSVLMGRRAAFGGPFSAIGQLEEGSSVRVTTGAGVFDYRVRSVRRSGDVEAAPPSPGTSRLVLATAAGRPFVPSGVLLVDADLTGRASPGGNPALRSNDLPASERVMAADTSSLWRLVLWLQALLAVVIGGIWAWHRWNRAKAWIVVLPLFLLVGLTTAGEAAHLLPNLL